MHSVAFDRVLREYPVGIRVNVVRLLTSGLRRSRATRSIGVPGLYMYIPMVNGNCFLHGILLSKKKGQPAKVYILYTAFAGNQPNLLKQSLDVYLLLSGVPFSHKLAFLGVMV